MQALEKEGDALLSVQELARAMDVFDQAARATPSPAHLLAKVDSTRKRWELAQEAAKLLDQARHTRSLSAAFRLVHIAAELDPTNQDLQQMNKQVLESCRLLLSERFPSGSSEWEEELVKWAAGSEKQQRFRHALLHRAQNPPSTDFSFSVDENLQVPPAILAALVEAPASIDALRAAQTRLAAVADITIHRINKID
jgi:hypothetical protein